MYGKIKILDESVSNIIAAGEVVENPESMIKELVENSLDAKADNIKIDIKNSGRYVKITDNGEGMNKEDIFLSIERHATSKISQKEDIFNLNTYGFRGEALASIASVSKLAISSKTEKDKVGTTMYSVGGNITKTEEKAMNIGTEIEVKDLFFNTPARLKFLRTKNTEYAKVKDIVLKESLVNYNVSITLTFDDKEILKTSGKGIENTMIEIFGKNVFKNMLKFKYGYLGSPDISRATKDYIFTYFNKRYAKSKIVEKSVIDSYYTKLDKGKYPFSVIFFDIEPSKIDVNVHPSKKIVRFSNESDIYSEIKNEILSTFSKNEISYMPVIKDKFIDTINSIKNTNEDIFGRNEFKIKENNPIFDIKILKNEYDEKNIENIKEKNNNIEKKYINENLEKLNLKNESKIEIKEEEKKYNDDKEKEEYKILGQLNNMYIISENKSCLEIYDQHIVHERILYEDLKEKFYSKKIQNQNLLVPIVLNVDYKQKELIFLNREIFCEFGFDIEEFGEYEIIIRKVPVFDFRESVKNVFYFLLEELSKENDIKDIREKIIISMSCKGAIKAGEVLSIEDMEEIIKKLHKIGKYTCPHGRPIIVKIPYENIEKMFKRR